MPHCWRLWEPTEAGVTVPEVAVHNGVTREPVVVDVDSAAVRWIGALDSVCCWLLLLLAYEHPSHWHPDGVGWSFRVMAVALVNATTGTRRRSSPCSR
jgi:hypothetical protein